MRRESLRRIQPPATRGLQHRRPMLFLLLIVAIALTACTKSQPAPAETVAALDHVDSAHLKPIHFLQKTFPVKKNVHFQFAVPAHTAIPRLHGTFKSFVPRPGADSLSDDSTDVDFLLMNPDQFSDFSRGNGGGTALYSVDPTHDHEVDFVLPPTQDDSATYYIVFRNSPGGVAQKQVTADFSVQFGYQ
jgi:hypothetical protein